MSKVTVNREVLLKFEDGKGKYIVRNPGCNSGLNILFTNSPIGRAIYGKKEGELVEFFNSKGELVRVKILKIFNYGVVETPLKTTA